MSDRGIVRWIAGRVFGLPARKSRDIVTARGIAIPMRDGVHLVADRYAPREAGDVPVLLIRSCYGRSALFGIMASLLAERGLQVVIQSVRGTVDSEGQFDPMRQEKDDGADTIEWIRAQSWFTGKLFTFGLSYLGNAEWALANGSADKLDGLALVLTLSNFRDELLSFGGYTLAGTLAWTNLMRGMVEYVPGQKMRRPDPRALDHVHGHLPLGTLDQTAFGKTVPWWQDWINHDDPDDPWWKAIDHSEAVGRLSAPATLVAGWQDIFLPFQMRDFEALQAAGRDVWLTIGPWGHTSIKGIFAGLKEAIDFYLALADDRTPYAGRQAVRLYLRQAEKWLEFPSWPPPGATQQPYFLRTGGVLDPVPATGAEDSVHYLYDPAEPTPSVHGPGAMRGAKVWDMSVLEQRQDTVLFTSDVLERDMDVIGPVSVDLALRSNRGHTDLYVCLCDVDRKGRSLQVLDGYRRLRPGSPEADPWGVRRVTIECWPTAYRFKKGHRLRLILASGAHPRYARNLGTGEPLATAIDMVTAEQEILLGDRYNPRLNLLHSAS